MKELLIITLAFLLLIGCAVAPPRNYLVTKSDLAINVTNCFDGIEVVYTTLKKADCITPSDTLSEKCQVTFYKDTVGLKMKVTRNSQV